MKLVNQVAILSTALVIAVSVPLVVDAQEPAAAAVRTAPSVKTKPPTMNQKIIEKEPAENYAATKDKGNPGPLPCDSKNNPKCKPATPSKHSNGIPNSISQ